MTRKGRPPPTAGLVAFLLDAVRDEPLADELTGWLSQRPRFRAFVDAHRDKVRKKLRTAPDVEGRRDVRAELLVARLLLADRRMELALEPYGSATGGPDFRVTMRGQAPFNLEVTRLRTAADDERIAGQLLTKLRQLPPSVANAVLVAVGLDRAESVDLAAMMRRIRARADAKDEPFFTGRGFEGTKGFYQRFLRLGGAFVFRESASHELRATLWTNPSASIAIPPRAARASLELLRESGAHDR